MTDLANETGRLVVISPGVRVPYPTPTSAAASAKGRANRRVGSSCEQALRSLIHRSGLRFRKDYPVRVDRLRVRPDIVFTRRKVAVFVDGCFWHSCPEHGTTPKSNLGYWGPKLSANVSRDRRVDDAMTAAGWSVVRVWEHEDPQEALERVAAALASR